MTRHMLSLGLAVLATGFLLACQDPSPNLVTPDLPGPEFDHKPSHNPGGGGGGGSPNTVLASASGAIENLVPDPHLMDVYKDNKFVLNINTNPDSRGTIRRSFLQTYAVGIEACWREGPEDVSWDTLFGLLNGSVGDDGSFGMAYDRSADGQVGDHGAGSRAFHAGIGAVHIGMTPHFASVVGTQTKERTADGVDEYTISGDVVRIWRKVGPPKKQQKIFCPNADDQVVVTVFP